MSSTWRSALSCRKVSGDDEYQWVATAANTKRAHGLLWLICLPGPGASVPSLNTGRPKPCGGLVVLDAAEASIGCGAERGESPTRGMGALALPEVAILAGVSIKMASM